MYHFIDRLHMLYGLLQDEQSKDIFQAMFAFDMDPSVHNSKRLVSLGSWKEISFLVWPQSRKDTLKKLDQEHKKIILYGTAPSGREIAGMLQSEDIDFYGFCGQDAKEFPDGLLGKPVLSPDELVSHGDEYYVLPAVGSKKSYREIFQFLQECRYPADHMLGWADYHSLNEQYFEFPALYRRGTAFIDGGCYDCGSSRKFAEWCENKYSSIIAFEPDPGNYAKCCERIRNDPLPNIQLVNAGLSSREGTVAFNSKAGGASHIIYTESDFDNAETNINNISIRTVAVDDMIGDRTVGFIKLDIEGAEFDALHGAKDTISRDKPLIAVCVYHLQGDLFAIMDYLHQVLPEYRFMLRHYGVSRGETVLYASVDL